jgi:hypothetical protein
MEQLVCWIIELTKDISAIHTHKILQLGPGIKFGTLLLWDHDAGPTSQNSQMEMVNIWLFIV